MRTIVDLPSEVHARVEQLAAERRQSPSEVIVELTIRGLASLGESVTISTEKITGLPKLTVGQRITAEDVAESLNDE